MQYVSVRCGAPLTLAALTACTAGSGEGLDANGQPAAAGHRPIRP